MAPFGQEHVGSPLFRSRIARFSEVLRRLPAVGRLLSMNVGVAAATFATGIILARSLDPAARGDLANVILWPMLLSNLALGGIHIHLSRVTAQRPQDAAHNYRVGYRALFLSSVVALAAYAAILAVAGHTAVSGLGLAAALAAAWIMPFSSWNGLQVQMELGRQSIGTYSWARTSFAVAHLVLVAGLCLAQWHSPSAYLWAFILAAISAAVSSHVVIGRTLNATMAPAAPADPGVSPQTVFCAFRAAWPFAVSTGFIVLATSVDRAAVSVAFDARTMGLYVIALSLSQVQSVLTDALSPLFFARVAQRDSISGSDPAWLAMRLRQTVLINVCISAGLLMVSPVLLPVIYGSAYRDSLQVLYLLVPAMSVRSMMQPFQEVLKGGNLPMSQSFAITVMTAIFGAGALVAAWAHSLPGVAAALLISSLAGLSIVAFEVSKECGLGSRHLLVPRWKDALGLWVEIKRAMGR